MPLSFAGVALVLIAVSGNIHSKLPTRHTKTSSLTQTGGEHAYSGSDTKEPPDAKTAASGVDVGSRPEELSVGGYNVRQILLGGAEQFPRPENFGGGYQGTRKHPAQREASLQMLGECLKSLCSDPEVDDEYR